MTEKSFRLYGYRWVVLAVFMFINLTIQILEHLERGTLRLFGLRQQPLVLRWQQRQAGLLQRPLGCRARVLVAPEQFLAVGRVDDEGLAVVAAAGEGWRAEEQSRNAEQVAKLGKELYKRLSVMGGHAASVGKALEAADKDFTIHVYEGVQHAFNNDTNPARYNQAAAELAWQRTIDFLTRKLKS